MEEKTEDSTANAPTNPDEETTHTQEEKTSEPEATSNVEKTEEKTEETEEPKPTEESKKTEEEEKIEEPKPKKSRWNASAETNDETAPKAAPRRSRFSTEAAPVVTLPAAPKFALPVMMSQEQLQETMILKIRLEQINKRMATVVADALVIDADPNRSPSPPPKYDGNGKRSNTREVRMREALNAERSKLIEGMLRLNPQFQTPADFVKAKPFRKIYMKQQQENPTMNYIGLIIGPRGNTQRSMEAESGAKISIRGKGSTKQGSMNRVKQPDDDDDLHVHITADEESKVEKAAVLVDKLLNPSEEDLVLHKQKQLRELALINGTLREDEYCPVCGEKGHRQFECPHRSKAFKAASVKCAICGDLSHPTRDCPLKEDTSKQNAVSLDTEYDSFMAELTGGGGPPPPSSSSSSSSSSSNGADSSKNGGNGTNDNYINYTVTNTSSAKVVGLGLGRTGKSTLLAPSVDLFSKKKQTVISVSTVMTGNALPSYLQGYNPNPSPNGNSIPVQSNTAPHAPYPQLDMPPQHPSAPTQPPPPPMYPQGGGGGWDGSWMTGGGGGGMDPDPMQGYYDYSAVQMPPVPYMPPPPSDPSPPPPY